MIPKTSPQWCKTCTLVIKEVHISAKTNCSPCRVLQIVYTFQDLSPRRWLGDESHVRQRKGIDVLQQMELTVVTLYIEGYPILYNDCPCYKDSCTHRSRWCNRSLLETGPVIVIEAVGAPRRQAPWAVGLSGHR